MSLWMEEGSLIRGPPVEGFRNLEVLHLQQPLDCLPEGLSCLQRLTHLECHCEGRAPMQFDISPLANLPSLCCLNLIYCPCITVHTSLSALALGAQI